MVNPEFSILKEWMFGKLNFLLKDLKHNPDYKVLRMSLYFTSFIIAELPTKNCIICRLICESKLKSFLISVIWIDLMLIKA